ncbi:MAG: hypothetical protein IH840_01770 [Candidatus Heimdallarchaeota archaeon]|nr:hypothetical protein [Candidatus Heimdallarchaeota archaeon]
MSEERKQIDTGLSIRLTQIEGAVISGLIILGVISSGGDPRAIVGSFLFGGLI